MEGPSTLSTITIQQQMEHHALYVATTIQIIPVV